VCNFTSAQRRALEKVQCSVQFYLCPELGIIKSAMLAPFLPQEWVKVGHFISCFLKNFPNIPAGYDENQI
jgi:hypothetical protein